MPIYEYRCDACGHAFEALQKISDDALKDCPECGKPALRKLISASAFRLKGGGWYETDFKTGSKRNIAGSAKKGGADSSPAPDKGSSGGTSEKKSSES